MSLISPPAKKWSLLVAIVLAAFSTVTLGPQPNYVLAAPRAAQSDSGSAELSCFNIGDLRKHWPPSNPQVVFFDEVNKRQVNFDFSNIPFLKVMVISAVCDDLRGRGEEAYITFQTDETADVEHAVLGVLNPKDGNLELIGPVGPADTLNGELTVDDVVGDGKDDIIFSAPGDLEIWGTQGGKFVFLLRAESSHAYELKDVLGDGKSELVVWRDPPGASRAQGVRWPSGAFRWTGKRFDPVLAPSLYAAPLAEAEAKLSNLNSAEFLLAMGHAYQNLGKKEQADQKYSLAWKLHENDAALPACSEAADAVQDYYQAIRDGDLIRAYKHLGPDLQKGFAGFAAGYAQTLSVFLPEPPEAGAEANGVVTVNVKFRATDLTPTGPSIQDFSGTWHVRKSDCAMLGARMHKE